MLSINFIRQNKELVKQKLQIKNFNKLHIVDDIFSIDEKRRNIQMQSEKILADINLLSKNIGQLISQGNKEEAEINKIKVGEIKNKNKIFQDELNDLEKQQFDLLVQLPNLPSENVPNGKTPDDNICVKEGGKEFIPKIKGLPHWVLCKKYELIDFELGNKVSGSGFPFYTNQGAKLNRALINYFLQYNTNAGYKEYLSPILVNENSAFGTGQLPDKEGQMYYVKEDNLYLIPTAEVPLTNIFRDEIINKNKLPIKLTGYTPCFRREAGSYGKDVRGLNRLHQFDKVEIVQIVEPEKSYSVLEEMVNHVEKLLISLELPYRILKLCGGDMGFASSLTYDFEVYSSAQEKWLEVSSVSNFESFQTTRMKIRTKNEDEKIQILHSLNGSSLALPRIMAALLENNQTEFGINIPKVLHSFFGNDNIK